MTRSSNLEYPASVTVAFDLLVEGDGDKQHAKLHAAAAGFRETETAAVAPPKAPAAVLGASKAMSAGEVLQELLGRLYVDHSKLKFLELVGEGGFASVHKCEMHVVLNLHSTVAVKMLKPEAFEGVDELKEFLLEANILRKMHHPHIVEMLGVGATDLTNLSTARSSMFIVQVGGGRVTQHAGAAEDAASCVAPVAAASCQEYMGGGDLKALLVAHMGRPLDPLFMRQDALRWGLHIAEAMHYLHAVCRPAVVHRDLKLENVLLTEGPRHLARAKLADFGLHKRVRRSPSSHTLADHTDRSAHGADRTRSTALYGGDNDKSFYGGDHYYNAVVAWEATLVTPGAGEADGPPGAPQVGERGSRGQAAPALAHTVPWRPGLAAAAATDANARLLALIQAAESGEAVDDVSVHRKRQALQALDRSSMVRSESPPLPPPPGGAATAAAAAAAAANGDAAAPAPLPASRLSRVASYGNLTHKRVLFMDTIEERRMSDSSLPRPSLDKGNQPDQVGGGRERRGDEKGESEILPDQGPTDVRGSSLGSSGVRGGSGLHRVGSSALLTEATKKVGSLLYMAPEMCLGQAYSEKVDVFAYGVLLYELFMGQSLLVRLAIRGEVVPSESEAFMMDYAHSVANGFREEVPEWWPAELRRLIADCWHASPAHRPSFATILQRLHQLHESGAAAEMDSRRKKGYNPGVDCGCCVM